MRIGLIARSDTTGLAHQTWEFWKHMEPAVTMVADLGRFGFPADLDRFAGGGDVRLWPAVAYQTGQDDPMVDRFLDDVDVVFSAETFYDPSLTAKARARRVRTVLQPNWEHCEYLAPGAGRLPDVLALPTRWYRDEYLAEFRGRCAVVDLPVPVDTERFPWRRRWQLERILHTAGTVAEADRNGTQILMRAMALVKTPVKARVYTQRDIRGCPIPNNVELVLNQFRWPWELYGDEDLFVMPRRFGGLCLPMQEAMAVGMPPLTSDLSPQNEVLPHLWLVPATPAETIPCRRPITAYDISPGRVAAQIDWLYHHPEALETQSDWCERWAKEHSWDALRPLYLDVLSG